MPTASRAEEVAQRESLVTRNWIITSVVALLFLVVQSLLTYNITSAMTKLDVTNLNLAKVLTAQEVQQVINRQVDDKLKDLFDSRKEDHKTHQEYEQRLTKLEQR